MAAPNHNVNAAKPQNRSRREWASLGKLPSHCSYVRRQAGWFHRDMERAVVAAKGELSTHDRALCLSLGQLYVLWQLAVRDYRRHGDSLTPTEAAALRREMREVVELAMRKLEGLGISSDGKGGSHDPFSGLYAAPGEAEGGNGSEGVDGAKDATGASTEHTEGEK